MRRRPRRLSGCRLGSRSATRPFTGPGARAPPCSRKLPLPYVASVPATSYLLPSLCLLLLFSATENSALTGLSGGGVLGRGSPSGGRRTRRRDSSRQTPCARPSCGGRTGVTGDPAAQGRGAARSQPAALGSFLRGHGRAPTRSREKRPARESRRPTEPFRTAAADAPLDTGAGGRWEPAVLRTTPGRATAPGPAYEASVPVAETARGSRAPAKVSGLSTHRGNSARVTHATRDFAPDLTGPLTSKAGRLLRPFRVPSCRSRPRCDVTRGTEPAETPAGPDPCSRVFHDVPRVRERSQATGKLRTRRLFPLRV